MITVVFQYDHGMRQVTDTDVVPGLDRIKGIAVQGFPFCTLQGTIAKHMVKDLHRQSITAAVACISACYRIDIKTIVIVVHPIRISSAQLIQAAQNILFCGRSLKIDKDCSYC